MFERFTDRARRVVVLAQEEARLLNHSYIGTEHILLGLIHEGEGVAAKALESLGISLEAVRSQVEEIIGQGGSSPSGHIPFTPRAKKVLELSLREALQLGHNYIGTEHILLGLIREGEGVAAQVLVKLGADLSRVRQQVIQLLSRLPGRRQGKGEPQAAAAGHRGAARKRRQATRATARSSTSSAATSPSSLARRSSIRSSVAPASSSGSCRSSAAAPRTTRCSSASPASARPRSSRASPRRSSATTSPTRCATSSCTRSTSAHSSPAAATAATSRSA